MDFLTLYKYQLGMNKTQQKQLLDWYNINKRELPWRKNRNPYYIWISETMLQQTTTQAVIPYFKRFIQSFPSLDSLANAPESQVLENWAGLGYYSRARNLHKAAKILSPLKAFPQSYKELIEYPGFGPYTARAVSSIAFDENVGVLDGNVIRVICRKEDWTTEWWKTKGRQQLQDQVDKYVNGVSAHQMNQALMELGATVCTPKSPQCFLCPWLKSCKAQKVGSTAERPLKKPKKNSEIWVWRPYVIVKNNKVALQKNDYAPFLKDQWFLPGKVLKMDKKPKTFDYKHAITHHNIYVQKQTQLKDIQSLQQSAEIQWVNIKELKKWTPSSLVAKIFE